MAVYTVAQVIAYLKRSLEHDPFLGDLWISGDVSNLSRSAAGHLYFTLKDAQGQLRCVMFRASTRGGDLLNDGDSAIVHCRISFYPARGNLQAYVDLVQPSGTGAFQLEFQRLKVQLEEEGLFEPSRKRPLPAFPHRIGVITSPTGAVFHDICNVLRRRYPLVEVLLSPTPVQGDEAAPGIAEALRTLNDRHDVDVIMVARGGGSIEELWPFNEERVARAIYASRIPVVSGVGHETDVTISDLVADLRAPTPSAAAEMVVPDAQHLKSQIALWQQTVSGTLRRMIEQRRQRIDHFGDRLTIRTPQVQDLQQQVDELTGLMARGLTTYVNQARERFGVLERWLYSVDPAAILKRGYAFVEGRDDGHLVTSVSQARRSEALTVTVSDGSFDAKVV